MREPIVNEHRCDTPEDRVRWARPPCHNCAMPSPAEQKLPNVSKKDSNGKEQSLRENECTVNNLAAQLDIVETLGVDKGVRRRGRT